MAKYNQDIIHNSTFNFEYKDKASASRCNILIESIFHSHLLPELEKAISNNIPEGIQVELARLEINIGEINEKEIATNLGRRIRESLEEALQDRISINKNSLYGSTAAGGQMTGSYLIGTIEVFLQNGYFPFGLENQITIDNLITKVLEQNGNEFIGIIKKYGRYEPAIRRMAFNLSADTFDQILFALDAVNGKWIIEFRKILSYAKRERNLSQITGSEFLRTINYFILNYLLNETGPAFNKKKFSTSILKEFLLLNPDFKLLVKAVKEYTGNTTAIILINETLGELMANGKEQLPSDKYQRMDMARLIELLNSGSNGPETHNRQFLKDQIVQAINDPGKRKLLIERLNKKAINLIIGLFYSGDPKTLVNDLKTVRTDAFQSFVRSQKNSDLKRLHAKTVDAQQYPDIPGIHQSTLNSIGQESTNDNGILPDNTAAREYYSIYSRKIIGYYLDFGQLPSVYFDLNWKDVQTLFRDLIQQKDDFLVGQFRNNNTPESLVHRLNLLIVNLPNESLEEYFIHFFPEEYVILSKVIADVKQHFTIKSDSRIYAHKFEYELFITALSKSRGASSSGIFLFSLLQQLTNELANDAAGSEKFVQYMLSKPENITRMEALKNKKGANAEFRKSLESDFKLLINRLQFSELGTISNSEEVQSLIKNLIFYFQADQKYLLDILQKYRKSFFQVYALLKFYLPQNQLDPIEKSLLSRIGLKKEIELFQKYSDSVLAKIQEPELNLIQTFESYSPSESQKLKTFLMLIMSDEAKFEKFISNAEDYKLPANLKFANSKIQAYLQQLMSFSPGSLSARIDRKFWKSVVLSFGIRLFLNEPKTASMSFAGEFKSHLLQKLKAINELDQFYHILDKMSTSGLKELQEMVELRPILKIEKQSETPVNDPNYQDYSSEIHHYFSILKFYAQNGFFPWWAEKQSFPELTAKLNRISHLYPIQLEEIFLQIEKEEQLFERLIPKLPNSIVNEFNRLISAHSPLKVIWRDILQKDKESDNYENAKKDDLKDSDLLFKELYFSGDEAVANKWQKHDPLIVSQIKEYLMISPYFNFGSINPARWRQMVHEFSLKYYEPAKKKEPNQFHSEFLKYTTGKYANMNWPITLTTVYQHIKSLKNGITFPGGLIQLIDVETRNQTQSKETVNDVNNRVSTDEEGVEVKVYNAGLILFWPFLTRLFEHLSLLKNGAFINYESMNRAVYILQYLVYNDIDFPEYKLVLNKLLVGMQAQDHLVPFVTLTDNEIESTNSLLKGLINNWEKVKNSSPEGIQETFLQREGILRFQTDKVTLTVENKGVDILVESIPWNISLIKLAWMKVPIYVEWI